MNKDKLIGALYVTFAGVLWGMSGTAQEFTPKGAHPLTVGAVRIFLAGVAICAFMIIKHGKSFFTQGWSIKGLLLASGGLISYQLSFFTALRLTGVGLGTMIAMGAAPPIAGLLGRIVFGEKLSLRWFVSTAMAIVGCAFLILGGNKHGINASLLGIALALISGLSYAVEGVGVKFIKCDALMTVGAIFALASVCVTPIFVIYDSSWIFTTRGIICSILLSFVCLVMPYCIFTKGVRKISLGAAYTFGLSEPLTACFLSTVLLGERMSFTFCIGSVLLFAGIIILAGDTK